MKVFTVAILGCGSRGCFAYGNIMFGQKDKYKIVALCDMDGEKLETYSKTYGVPTENCFLSEEEFWEEKRADLVVIATLDADHVRQGVKALSLGYDVLLEKPISKDIDECNVLLEAKRKYGGKVLVCHVLRYAPAYLFAKKLLDEGFVGKLVNIQAIERVSFWHQAHSYVRGNWRKESETAPMIMAKCCHDLDLLQYYAGAKCKALSSMGDLTFFKKENAPKGSADRCTECQWTKTCPYSAEKIYIDFWKMYGSKADAWPQNVITNVRPLTEEALHKAIKKGAYGKCVFRCDNDVVDNQTTVISFENGVVASLTMTAFTAGGGRIYKFMGTEGEIIIDEQNDYIEYRKFQFEEEATRIAMTEVNKDGFGHGGGDLGLVNKLYDILCGVEDKATTLEASIESHLMCVMAERSRVDNGKLIFAEENVR